ncbi:MAG: hypothetical protein Aurels2KO_52600 [Aureliella sp.]
MAADDESYCLIESREVDARWDVPQRAVEPKPISRMYLASQQDCGPKPIDDAAAQRWMNQPGCIDNTRYYSKIPTRSTVENPVWLDYLPRDEDGEIQLTQPLAMDLALIHSRDYQTQFEQVYLSALNLSGNRFEFDTQWFGGLGAGFTATGSDLGDQRQLDVTANRLGFTRSLAGGGQFATSILNGLAWDFGSGGVQAGSASIVSTFTQPLLRGAFRHVRLEQLTQSERNLLYQVRDFARFRRVFYVDVATSYLNLLTRVQAISNQESNVENLRRSLTEYELLVSLKFASPIEADQVFQQYQNGRLSLLSSQQALIEQLDQFKFSLGLPPWVPMEIDTALLDQFELVNPEIEQLQADAQLLAEAQARLRAPSDASRAQLQENFARLVDLRNSAASYVTQLDGEFARWKGRLDATDTTALGEEDLLDFKQQVSLLEKVEVRLADLRRSFDGRRGEESELEALIARYPIDPPPAKTDAIESKSVAEALDGKDLDDVKFEDFYPEKEKDDNLLTLEKLQEQIGDRLMEEISELFVTQTQIRLFLLDLEPQKTEQEAAITFAHQNRLDLMNSKASVVDAFRRVEVAADSLQSDLSVTGGVAIGSDPTKNSPLRLDSSANRYSVGVEFDGPLNRLNERNAYRATQIAYQQAGRSFIADRDRVANEVRSVLRQLELSRLNFQIARQQLVAASRQVDSAQLSLRTQRSADGNLTIFLLQALDGLLGAKNNLISNWVQYRIQKMRLFAALEMLYLDENGTWLNEETGLDDLASFTAVDPEYFPLHWTTGNGAPGNRGPGAVAAGESGPSAGTGTNFDADNPIPTVPDDVQLVPSPEILPLPDASLPAADNSAAGTPVVGQPVSPVLSLETAR